MMCAYHEAAALNSVKVVHTAGVASLPFDLGAFLVAHHVVHELGGRCTHIRALTLPASQEHAALTALRPPLWASQQEDAGADAGAFAAAPAGVVVSGTTTAAVPSPAPPRPVAADAVTETVAIKKQHRPLATAADAIAAARAHGKSSTSPLAPRVVPPSLSLTSLLPGAIWWRRRSSTADTASDATRGASDCGGGGAAAMTSTTRLSGGSAASLMAMYLHTPTRQLWSLLTDPYLLLPDVREMAAGDEAGHLAGLLPAGAEEELQRLFEARRCVWS